MLPVPKSLSQAFEAQLNRRNMPDQQRGEYHKWLRFYLDFCAKYASETTMIYTHTVPSVTIKEAKSPLDF